MMYELFTNHWIPVIMIWIFFVCVITVILMLFPSKKSPTTILRNRKDWADQIKMDQLIRPMSHAPKAGAADQLEQQLLDENLAIPPRIEPMNSYWSDEELDDDPYWPEDLPRPRGPDHVVNLDDPDFTNQLAEALKKGDKT
jgi:hypothetical protein